MAERGYVTWCEEALATIAVYGEKNARAAEGEAPDIGRDRAHNRDESTPLKPGLMPIKAAAR